MRIIHASCAGLFLGFVLACATTTQSHAGLSWAGNAYAVLGPNGVGPTYYNVNNAGDTGSPQFTGNLGGLSIVEGQSLLLGGELQTYPGWGGTDAASLVSMFYQIDNGGWGSIPLPFKENVGNNDKWQQADLNYMVNIAPGVGAGSHTLAVYYEAINKDGSAPFRVGSSGTPYTAEFTIQAVPEPAHYGLICAAGLLGVVLLQRRSRKAASSR